MLQRTTTHSWLPVSSEAWPTLLHQGLSSSLLQYLLLVMALCVLACTYLWQASEVAEIHKETLHLQADAQVLERTNVSLTKQWAQWNTPSYVERRMREEGYVKVEPVIHTQLHASADVAWQSALPASSGQ